MKTPTRITSVTMVAPRFMASTRTKTKTTHVTTAVKNQSVNVKTPTMTTTVTMVATRFMANTRTKTKTTYVTTAVL